MTTFMFIASVVACGLLLSFLPGDETTANRPDYHLVPFAGDAFGA